MDLRSFQIKKFTIIDQQLCFFDKEIGFD